MRDRIISTLREVERENNFEILYACESGSRAWGFSSTDSDYDVRFIYAHPAEWYLRLEKRPDTVDEMLPDKLDLSGWELRKTLRLFAGCNLALNEWLGSPEIYCADEDFQAELRELIPEYFNKKKAMFHYLSMAEKILSDNPLDSEIKIKKLFYILRPLLACGWISKNGTMPPTEFTRLLEEAAVPDDIRAVINDMLARKQGAVESDLVMIPHALRKCIEVKLFTSRKTAEAMKVELTSDWEPLNKLMLKIVNHA